MASDNSSNQPCAIFSEAGDHFAGEDNLGRFPGNTQYHVAANVWLGKLAILHGCLVSQNEKVVMPQGLALAIFLRFRPTFLGGAENLTCTRYVLRDSKLAAFIDELEPHVAAEFGRSGEGDWTSVFSAYKMLGDLQHEVSCTPDDFLLTEPMGSGAAARDRADTEEKFKNWTFGMMVRVASYEVAADFMQNLGNHARISDKTGATSNYFYLLKQLLKKMPEEDREHWDASAGLLRLFAKSAWPASVTRDIAATAPDFLAQITKGIAFSTEATSTDAWADSIELVTDAFPLFARLFEGVPNPRSAVQRMTHSAGLEKGLNQAVLEGLENKIDEHLRDRLDDYSTMEPAKRIAKACDEMQAAMARVQQAYSRSDEGTTEQALAQLQSQMSVNKSVVYANMSAFVKTVEDKSHIFRLFNYGRQNLGAYQFSIQAFFNTKSAPAKDLIVMELHNARVSFGAYLTAEVKGPFNDNIEAFSLLEDEVAKLRSMKLASFDVDAFLWRFRCAFVAGFKSQYPKPCMWSKLPNCMGLAFGPLERLLYALGFNAESVSNLVAMLEEVLFVGGIDGPASANEILRKYLGEAEKILETFAMSSRSLDKLQGPAQSGAAFATYTSIKKAAADELRAQQLDSMRGRDSERHGSAAGTPKRGAAALIDRDIFSSSPVASPKKSKHPTLGKGGKGSGKGASQQGSMASRVSFGKNGEYVSIARTYYDLKTLKQDLAANNSAFPLEYAYVALLKTNDKLPWCPAGATPPSAVFEVPFAGFVIDKYLLGREQPQDF